MKFLPTILFLTISQVSFAQIKLTKPGKDQLPENIKYTGDFLEAVRWTDKTGDNIVVLSLSGKTKSKASADDDNNDASLYAYHFIVSGSVSNQTWRVYDYVKDCSLDLILNFVPNSFAVTDLNNDGKAEIWIMYKASCQGDVSPVPMKIIMYENDKKYAARGTSRVNISEQESEGGEYAFDEGFKKGPAVFRNYAEKLWQLNVSEIK